jgi:hypothetical protein
MAAETALKPDECPKVNCFASLGSVWTVQKFEDQKRTRGSVWGPKVIFFYQGHQMVKSMTCRSNYMTKRCINLRAHEALVSNVTGVCSASFWFDASQAFCVLRGLPVMLIKFLKQNKHKVII